MAKLESLTPDELLAAGWKKNYRGKFFKRTWRRKTQAQASELEQSNKEPPEEDKAVVDEEDSDIIDEDEIDDIEENGDVIPEDIDEDEDEE